MKIHYITEENFLPRKGIYFLYDSGEIVYIGQTNNLPQRIVGHIKEGTKTFDSYSFYECDPDTLDSVEFEEIIEHKPKYNKTLPLYPDWIIKPRDFLISKGMKPRKKTIKKITEGYECVFSSFGRIERYKLEDMEDSYKKYLNEIHNNN